MTRDPHDRCREALALRLYGDVEPAESAFADTHLAGCTACRDEAAALDATLGRLVLARAGRADAGYRERAGAPESPAQIRGRRRWFGRAGLVAASFAAGVALTLALAPLERGRNLGPSAGTRDDLGAIPAPAPSSFSRAAPPPRAPTNGLFSEFRRS